MINKKTFWNKKNLLENYKLGFFYAVITNGNAQQISVITMGIYIFLNTLALNSYNLNYLYQLLNMFNPYQYYT